MYKRGCVVSQPSYIYITLILVKVLNIYSIVDDTIHSNNKFLASL